MSPHCLENRLTDGVEPVSLKSRLHFTPAPPFYFLLVVFVRGYANSKAIVLL
jgi:hypothetical protein